MSNNLFCTEPSEVIESVSKVTTVTFKTDSKSKELLKALAASDEKKLSAYIDGQIQKFLAPIKKKLANDLKH